MAPLVHSVIVMSIRPAPPNAPHDAALGVPARITVLSGGVGGARFLQGLLRLVERTGAGTRVTVVANTADDIWVHGLKVCPDLDTVMYTLGDGHRPRARLGSRRGDLARQGGARGVRRGADLVRSRRPRPGHPPRAHPDARRRLPAQRGDRGPVPAAGRPGRGAAADDRRPGRDPRGDRRPRRPGSGARCTSRSTGSATTRGDRSRGRADRARGRRAPGPGVLEAITDTDLVLVPPSNPVVSVGTILGVPGVRGRARRAPPAPVVGVSGIIGGDHVHGMARQLLGVIGVEVSAAGVAEHYGARSARGRPRRLAGRHRRRGVGRAGRGGRDPLPRRTPVDDRPRRDGRHGGRGPRARPAPR